MRTKLFALALVTCFSTFSFAQEGSDTKFRFGLKVAPTLAWLKPETKNVEADGAKIGFAYGLIADYNFSQNYALGTGVEVSYRGGKLKSEVTENGVTTKATSSLTLQYIELPLTMKLKTNEIGYITYFGKFGFAPGINIRAEEDREINGVNENDVSIKSSTSVFNLSFLVGLGAQYSLGGKTAVMTGITFNNGFLDIDEQEGTKVTSSFIALDLGVMF